MKDKQSVSLKKKLWYFLPPALLGALISVPTQNPLGLVVGCLIGWIGIEAGEPTRVYLHEEGMLPTFLARGLRVRDITKEVRQEQERDQTAIQEVESVIALPERATAAGRSNFTVPVNELPEEAPTPQTDAPVKQMLHLPEQTARLFEEPAPAKPKLEATWESLIAARYLRPDAPYLLAVQKDGTPIEMPVLTSLGVGGAPGSGKTVTMTSLVMQTIAKYDGKVRFLVVDPHMHSGSDDALVARLLPGIKDYLFDMRLIGDNPTPGGEDLLRWITYLESGIRGRLAGSDIFEGNHVVLIADEFASLVDDEQVGRPLLALIDLMNSQARKVRGFAMVASPHWKATRIPTDLRSTLPTFLVHQMPTSIAQQIVPASVAQQSNQLATGEVIAFSRNSAGRGNVPYTESGILAVVARKFYRGSAEGIQPVSSAVHTGTEPSFKDVVKIARNYQGLRSLMNSDSEAVHILALDTYGRGDGEAERLVRRALELAEEHSVA